MKNNFSRRSVDRKSRIINRQAEEIDRLKKKISELEIGMDKKDELFESVDYLVKAMENTSIEIQGKKKEYDRLIDELRQMRKIMDEEVYKKKWWIIKFLIR